MKRMNYLIFTSCVLAVFCFNSISYGDQTIISKRVSEVPVINGIGDDSAWEGAREIITHDKTAGIDIRILSVYNEKEIFFKVVFPDPDESRHHKVWIWNKDLQLYRMGPEREDCFVFKWNMAKVPKDLSVYSDDPYVADVWFWKACRTDKSGFADDKIQQLSPSKMKKSRKMNSLSGRTMYLQRKGDKGTPAYKNKIYSEFKGNKLAQFKIQVPKGSRADIKARGVWSKGQWTIEFSRRLKTGHEDDIKLLPGKKYQFGISRYEVAGRPPDVSLSQPLYGAGDVSERLYLKFNQ